jgi:PBP1b-binding outer membrane lipoprotein LpoB
MTKSSLIFLLLAALLFGGCASSYDGYKYKPYTLRGVRYHPMQPRQAVGRITVSIS